MPNRSTVASASTGTPRPRTNSSGPNRSIRPSVRCKSPGLVSQATRDGPSCLASANPITAPKLIPSHEAAVPPSVPNCEPANVLTRLDGTGKNTSVARRPITAAATSGHAGGSSRQAASQFSTRSPNKTKGTIGIARTTIIGSIGLSKSRTGLSQGCRCRKWPRSSIIKRTRWPLRRHASAMRQLCFVQGPTIAAT